MRNNEKNESDGLIILFYIKSKNSSLCFLILEVFILFFFSSGSSRRLASKFFSLRDAHTSSWNCRRNVTDFSLDLIIQRTSIIVRRGIKSKNYHHRIRWRRSILFVDVDIRNFAFFARKIQFRTEKTAKSWILSLVLINKWFFDFILFVHFSNSKFSIELSSCHVLFRDFVFYRELQFSSLESQSEICKFVMIVAEKLIFYTELLQNLFLHFISIHCYATIDIEWIFTFYFCWFSPTVLLPIRNKRFYLWSLVSSRCLERPFELTMNRSSPLFISEF